MTTLDLTVTDRATFDALVAQLSDLAEPVASGWVWVENANRERMTPLGRCRWRLVGSVAHLVADVGPLPVRTGGTMAHFGGWLPGLELVGHFEPKDRISLRRGDTVTLRAAKGDA